MIDIEGDSTERDGHPVPPPPSATERVAKPEPFHPSASHIHPEYRDGWNAALEAHAAWLWETNCMQTPCMSHRGWSYTQKFTAATSDVPMRSECPICTGKATNVTPPTWLGR